MIMGPDELKQFIDADLKRYFGILGRRVFWRTWLHIPGFRYSYFFRKASYYEKKRSILKYIYNIFLSHYQFKYGIQIPVGTKIGYGLHISHFGNVILNPGVVMGNNCGLSQGVTIGQINTGKKKGCPVIGNMVWIGANAVVVGNIVIGDNVLIAPNAFVNFDVPANSLVIGNPGKVIFKENPVEGYIEYTTNL